MVMLSSARCEPSEGEKGWIGDEQVMLNEKHLDVTLLIFKKSQQEAALDRRWAERGHEKQQPEE